ncbi:MAG: HD domain-containing phosphohydrolase [Pseudomonadota bacterium]
MSIGQSQEFFPARQSQLPFYRDIPLYRNATDGGFVLYKPEGQSLAEMRLAEGLLPEQLYINSSDKLKGLQEVQKIFNRQLTEDIRANNPSKVKDTIVAIMTETLSEPRSGSLEGVVKTVDILVSGYATESDVIKNLLFVSTKDYTTVLHSINVMALALVYASYAGFSLARKRVIGLCALLHDVGKTRIDTDLLTAPRKLTNEEFAEIKRHPVLGYDILSRCRFGDPEIKRAALEHHEKLDGSGYPRGRKDTAETSQIIAFIDCYEALTNNDRPYRSAMDPARALFLIKDDVMAGKFSRDIFRTFTRSLNK